MDFVQVKNWEKFQHYKKRNPPWIRLYNEILDDYTFGRLPDASKWHAVGLWLLASRFDNKIPADPEWIRQRIGATDPVDLPILLSAGFLVPYDDASDTLASRKQDAKPEGEGEGETEREPETDNQGVAASPDEPADPPADAPPPPPANWKDELRTIADELAGRFCTTDSARRSFEAATEMVIADLKANWKNPHTGETIPFQDRPELFRAAALAHFEKPSNNLASSLLYVRKRKLDPDHDEDAAKESAAAAKRRRIQEQQREQEVRDDKADAERWAQDNPEEYAEIQRAAEDTVQVQGFTRGMLVTAEVDRQVRARLEGEGARRAG
jgi:hypothetical protein